ncbi:MAG: type IX secretion system membrane protein PorP/SprF [Prevotellaceae bacterium]|jgi:type IX secretion system PorP/SprF family membrane protein|nr:type IX secretion system membrane protein PorP/SprF [Prevotellaceae bacterium]
MDYKYLILSVFICLCGTVKSQSDFDLSQRWFNESIYNPGATGNNFSTGVFFHSRAQWIGTDGAPITNAVSVDTYIENIRSGLGIAVYTDKIGYISSWSAKLAYAYYVQFSKKTSLSIGLSGYLHNRNSNISPDMLDQRDDPAIIYSKISEYSPNFDFGVEFIGPLKIGVSVRHLLKYEAVNSFFPPRNMSLWAYASSRFNVMDGISLEPATSYMYRSNVARIEAGAIVYFLKSSRRTEYNDKFWLGGMYRLNKQFVVLAGINLTSQLRIGYSFDYGVSDLTTISRFGTHEIFLSWHLSRIFYKDVKNCPAYRNYKIKR